MPALLRITDDLMINPGAISYMEWDHRAYINHGGHSVLVITMIDGREHRLEHRPWALGGIDGQAIEKSITEALASC